MSDTRPSLEAPQAGLGSAHTAGSAGTETGTERKTGRRRSDRIILASAITQQAVDQASSLARSNDPLLILGPDGSGRQHFARAIHAWSSRASGNLVVVSGGATPEALHTREIFGSTADNDPLSAGGNDGALSEAANGTLLIERVDLVSEGTRRRLAQVLREGHYQRPGSDASSPLLARILATGDSGAPQPFGELTVQTLNLAPLSERTEDVLPLAAHFLAEFAEEEGHTAVGFTVDARRWLIEEPWIGNVRELRERIRQAIRLAGSGSISAEALLLSTEGDEVPSFKEAKRAFETRYVEGLLRRCSGNISRAARLAKKDRKDFYDVIRRTGVDPTVFRS